MGVPSPDRPGWRSPDGGGNDVGGGEVQAWIYSAAFFAGLVGVHLAAGGNLRERHDHLAFLPRTRLGWWSVGLVAFAVLLFVAAIGLTFLSQQVGAPTVPMFVFSIAAFASTVAAGVVGLIAWFRRAERSWVVLLTLLPSFFAVYFVLGEFMFLH